MQNFFGFSIVGFVRFGRQWTKAGLIPSTPGAALPLAGFRQDNFFKVAHRYQSLAIR